jgi:RNA-binding protein Musashi
MISSRYKANGEIDPKRAIPRAEHEKTAKVFVGGLAAGVTSESLKIFLSQFGEVHDATVMYDRETNRSKGFAFATFANEDSVPIAMEASGIELEGKQVSLFVSPRPILYLDPGEALM